MFQCRYAGPARGQHYEQWREEFCRRWLDADFQALDGDRLVNEFSGTDLGPLGVCTFRGTPLHTTRRDDLTQQARGFIYVLVASEARLQTHQRGRSSDLNVGQMALISAAEPCRVLQSRGSRWSIRIPRRLLNNVCRDVDDRLARAVTADRELTKLLLHQVETAHRFGSRLDAQANNAMAQHVLDLVALCLGANRDAMHTARQRGLAAARLDSIKADILRHIGTTGLRLEQVAARHRVSARYIQHLFARDGTSFTSFLLEERLRLAHRLLRDPGNLWRKVSDIASAAGFPDVSYFNRAFKARFGITPRDARVFATPDSTADDAVPPFTPTAFIS
jgi:AraC-like DNA-binding protein